MMFGTLYKCHQWGYLSDVRIPPTWEKGSHLPPGTTKLGNLRDSHDSITASTAKPDLGFSSSMLGECWSVEPTQRHQKYDMVMHRYTRWTGRLSHQIAIYPALTIHCQRVVIHASLDTRFKGRQVVTYPANVKTTKVILTKSPPKRSGNMHMDK